MRQQQHTSTDNTVAILHEIGRAYCVAAHTAAMKHMGMTCEQIDGPASGHPTTELSPRETAIIEFARKANRHQHDIGDRDFEQLHAFGYSEADIVEALGTMELFAGFNRFARAMKVEVDF